MLATLTALNRSSRRLTLAGFAIIGVLFGGFGTWASIAELSSAAIAPGVVAVQSSTKTIQHLEGGIVKEILVRDGDYVEAGEVLIRLDDTRARASLEILRQQYWGAIVLRARLLAERDGTDNVDFPESVLARLDNESVAQALLGQQRIFETRSKALQGQIDILQQRTAQYRDEIAALNAQLVAEERQLKLIAEEIVGVRELYEKGLERKPRLLALQRKSAEIEGLKGQHLALIARTKQKIGETLLRIIDLTNRRLEEVVSELRNVEARIADVEERLRAATDVLERVEIRAPASGIVVGLRMHTLGAVVSTGEPILDLVPQNEKLIIEAKVQPEDIDSVYPGLDAEIRLTAYNRRLTPTVRGVVVYVSADSLVDADTGLAHYKARIELEPSSLHLLQDVELYPGMPAEVMIVTGKQSALDYMLAPLTERLARAFKE